MTWRERYENSKAALLADATICAVNRDLCGRFFAFEEYKLKRQNGLPDLDEACCKTLYGYIIRFRNVNLWFADKPWQDLTKEDIKRVYDALEDGTIRNRAGLVFQDRHSYYNKVFKSKPFRLAGKSELAKEIIEFSTQQRPAVRFLTEESFRTLVSVVAKPTHLLLCWLAWDIGENIDALLKLTRRDFIPQVNRYTQDREYVVNLPAAKIKRSRQSRSEPTLYPETVRYADMVLASLAPEAPLFDFGYRQAAKLLQRVVRKTHAATMPYNDPVRWKDFRSGMACHLLKNGWNRDEVNARLGHTPHSDALDAYINFLALDRERPKQRMAQTASERLQVQLQQARQTAKLAEERAERDGTDKETLGAELARTRKDIEVLRQQMERLIQSLGSSKTEFSAPAGT